MKKVNVYYAKINNMGDLLNKELIEKLYCCEVKRKNFLMGDVSGIGSGLSNFFYDDNSARNIIKTIFGFIHPRIYIWGTGFINYSDKERSFCKKATKLCAVRGELSKKRIEKMLGKKINIPTGDAGILASYLLDKKVTKKYKVGIIPHVTEQDHKIFKELAKKFDKSTVIDVCNDPITVTRQIAECEYIISSSLHGLIIADSLEIPNVHIVVTDKLLGDGFKFDDYYSAYGLKHSFIDMQKTDIDRLKDIRENYKLTHKIVEQKKKEMLNCFPYRELGLAINPELS